MTAVSRICFARTPPGCDMLPHPPYQALQPQKGCKTTFNCVVPAGHSVRGMPLRSTGLPSLPGRVQEIPLNAGALRGMVPPQAGRRRGRWAAREKAPVTARPNPPPISPCSLRRAPPFRCERSEQAEPPAYPGGPHHSAKFCSQNFAEPPTTPYRAPAKKKRSPGISGNR